MAGKTGTSSDALALLSELRERPYRFGFFQALRRLECAYDEKPRLGRTVKASDDVVRLGQEPSMAFPASTLASFDAGRSGLPPRMLVYFFGLFGPNGPLPLHLTEHARDRQRNSDDPTFARFADMFHHRMLSLFYRAWADAQPAVQFDRGAESDRFGRYVGTLFGLGFPATRERDAMHDLAKLHYAGRFASQTKSPQGLRDALAGYFGLQTEIVEFVGQWIDLPETSWCRLGEDPETGTLGRSLTVGKRIWDCQQKFRIRFGPMNVEEFRRMLPGSPSLDRLVALVRNYLGDELDWDVNLILKKEEVPPLKLDGSARLGWSSWIKSERADHDAEDVILHPIAAGVTGGRAA